MLNCKKNIVRFYFIKPLIILVLLYTKFWTFAIAQATEHFTKVINASDVTETSVKTSAQQCFNICIKDKEKILNITKHLIKGDHAFTLYEFSRSDSELKFPCAAFAISNIDTQEHALIRLFFRNLYRIGNTFKLLESVQPAQKKLPEIENLISTTNPIIRNFKSFDVQQNLLLFLDKLIECRSLLRRLAAVEDAESKSKTFHKKLSEKPVHDKFIMNLPTSLPKEYEIYTSTRANLVYGLTERLIRYSINCTEIAKVLKRIIPNFDITELKEMASTASTINTWRTDFPILDKFKVLPDTINSAENLLALMDLINSFNNNVLFANFSDKISSSFIESKFVSQLVPYITKFSPQIVFSLLRIFFSEISDLYDSFDNDTKIKVNDVADRILQKLAEYSTEIDELKLYTPDYHTASVIKLTNMIDELYIYSSFHPEKLNHIIKNLTLSWTNNLLITLFQEINAISNFTTVSLKDLPKIDSTLSQEILSVQTRMTELISNIKQSLDTQFKLLQKICNSLFNREFPSSSEFDKYIRTNFSPSIEAALGKFSKSLTDNVFDIEQRKESKDNLGFSIQKNFEQESFEEFICGESGYLASIGTSQVLRDNLKKKFPAVRVLTAIKGELKPDHTLPPAIALDPVHLNTIYLATFFPQTNEKLQ